MFKHLFKFIFYLMFIMGGTIIAFFIPSQYVFPFGYAIAMLTRWCWINLNTKEVSNG
jgi:hypothetical protein